MPLPNPHLPNHIDSTKPNHSDVTEIEKLVLQLNRPLESSRLIIRPQIASDANAAFAHLQDDALRQWISLAKPISVDALRQSWKRNETRISPDGREAWLQWFVTSKVDGSPIGSIDACVDLNKVGVNFGYYFFCACVGQGLCDGGSCRRGKAPVVQRS